ncbi:YwqH-like family protein [Edaphobacillus lindanitolerans]|uniref:Uncharacterized protein n=1 Tax=Edaphobacillus lindanitolerans TaxID=550447 RepID=A0A1U7PM71_9BACI|nr:DUF5082 family protein [Edaphobacillus lindanitolerans]SIT70669.1 protein of unknown function [Edaphobacillus lindanitolerans]
MIGYYMMLLQVKRQQIARLTACRGQLEGKQGEFQANEPKCTEPELTAKTWFGSLADKFDEIRESGIKAPYQDIQGTQFSAAYSAIAAKIAELQAEIASIEAIIAQLRAAEDAKAQS